MGFPTLSHDGYSIPGPRFVSKFSLPRFQDFLNDVVFHTIHVHVQSLSRRNGFGEDVLNIINQAIFDFFSRI